MTYAQMKEWLETLESENLQQDATVYDPVTQEYIPVEKMARMCDTDVLDEGHPVIILSVDEFTFTLDDE